MYAESNMTSSTIHMIHTDYTLHKYGRILFYSSLIAVARLDRQVKEASCGSHGVYVR